ncbi:GRF zinc finger [Apiospora arundinis]|uniref:GRF zinc finger domain-containing protein n=1 Tax=Apiospora arundinis TaxID=335852 RepID=A0ABR2ITB9_9PEZI
MEAFLKGRKRKLDTASASVQDEDDQEPTDVKLAMLSSLHPNFSQEALLEALLAHDGSVKAAAASLAEAVPSSAKRSQFGTVVGSQTSLKLFASRTTEQSTSPKKAKILSKKGATLHLYDPDDIADNTPCSIVHNFLPPEIANDLLKEMLHESTSFEKITFKLFDNVVSSPHTSTFYVETDLELHNQKYEYFYNGAKLTDVRKITPQLLRVKPLIQQGVNKEIEKRIKTKYPDGKKLPFQSPDPWKPNAAFANCYTGPQENVGYHSDQLTYLGPRAVIGSLSLGVAREFRVRRVVPKASDDNSKEKENADAEGQIAIHLPHNSLLVMHAEMQEEWKHSIAPAQAIDPHPIAGSRRINITYRDYKPSLHPKFTPRCKCGIPAVLKVVQKRKENWGKYFWMCHRGYVPEKENCSFFQWAEFDDDGNPSWDKARYKKGSSTKTQGSVSP